ncbi:hypothetical protein B296_00036993 [Ensete ventricosum]|uniref:Uncharacterized protein n=1 Tax=Ensete ventricosum TaxID=4639 RepID=A0A426ZVR8_ENSVE|nr:hypothetical protein B296_00036993 [Ensete ventricosum]
MVVHCQPWVAEHFPTYGQGPSVPSRCGSGGISGVVKRLGWALRDVGRGGTINCTNWRICGMMVCIIPTKAWIWWVTPRKASAKMADCPVSKPGGDNLQSLNNLQYRPEVWTKEFPSGGEGELVVEPEGRVGN